MIIPKSSIQNLSIGNIPMGKSSASPNIDYRYMTQGEMLLNLMSRRIDILSSYYGDDDRSYRGLKVMLENAIYNDLHNASIEFRGINDDSQKSIASIISKAKRQSKPASKLYFNTNDFKSKAQGIVGFSFDDIDCVEVRDKAVQDNLLQTRSPGKALIAGRDAYAECERQNVLRRIMNDNFEGLSHHVLYEFSTSSERGSNNDVSTKAGFHKNALSAISSLTSIDRANLVEWIHNGIMRSNTVAGTLPYEPRDTIEIIKQGGLNLGDDVSVERIGFIGELTAAASIALIKQIIGALITAYGLYSGYKSRLKAESIILSQSIDSLGFKEQSPDTIDWSNGSSSSNGSSGVSKAGLGIAGIVGVALLYFGSQGSLQKLIK